MINLNKKLDFLNNRVKVGLRATRAWILSSMDTYIPMGLARAKTTRLNREIKVFLTPFKIIHPFKAANTFQNVLISMIPFNL